MTGEAAATAATSQEQYSPSHCALQPRHPRDISPPPSSSSSLASSSSSSLSPQLSSTSSSADPPAMVKSTLLANGDFQHDPDQHALNALTCSLPASLTLSENVNAQLAKAQLVNANGQMVSPMPNDNVNGAAKVNDSVDSVLIPKKNRLSHAQRVSRIASAVSTILECLDDDPNREGLQKTPERYAKALLAITDGYTRSPKAELGDAEFDESHSELVMMRDVDVFSTCEHHLLPFHGRCHVAYIPSGSVIGLSKIARIIDLYARRFQVQERLTTQIADAIQDATRAQGVMVYMSCTHMCMAMRGVQKVGAETCTTAVRGRYAKEPDLRSEFLAMLGTARSSSHR